MSDVHIEKGQLWSDAVGKQLSESDFGVCCVTPENTRSPWLLFEAGAISKSLKDSGVFPILLGLQPSDLDGPLTQFHATVVERTDLLTLVKSLNHAMGIHRSSENEIDRLFNEKWSELEKTIETTIGDVAEVTLDTLQAVISDWPDTGCQIPSWELTPALPKGSRATDYTMQYSRSHNNGSISSAGRIERYLKRITGHFMTGWLLESKGASIFDACFWTRMLLLRS